MIYTVTFNPAIDYVVRADNIFMGGTNRTVSEDIFFGGKGINVSQVLAQLDIKSVALGFAAGFTGKAIEDGLNDEGIETDFVHIKDGFSRINVKLKSDRETEINGQGPNIDAAALAQLFEKLERLTEGDTLVLAGSVPASMPKDIYEQIMVRLDGRGIRFVVDAAGELLTNVLKYNPFLIKPNHQELGEIFKTLVTSKDKAVLYAAKLREMGARNVLVSMAGEGSVLVDENGEVYTCGVCKGKVRNSVGAGDSMVAGFLAGYDKGSEYALRLGTACGGATAFSDGLAKREDIDRLMSEDMSERADSSNGEKKNRKLDITPEERRLLSSIRRRPGMHLGKKSLERFWLWSDGYIVATMSSERSLFPDSDEIDIHDYAAQKYHGEKCSGALNWISWIQAYEKDDAKALDVCFEFLDEYLQLLGFEPIPDWDTVYDKRNKKND